MDTFEISFERVDTIRFVIDDDPTFQWLATEDTHAFGRIFIYIDANVQRIWGAKLEEALGQHRQQKFWMTVEPSESSKSLTFYPEALAFLEQHGAGRFDLVIAIGGGIVIDLVSFLTSTYMRGLPFFAIPTTLVGQMDASTAGKTCLNTDSAKNLLGTFYYPRVVYNNVELLRTNSKYYLRQGYSEIFKYGLLRSRQLIALLENHRHSDEQSGMQQLIRRSIDARVDIRKQDPLASNLGHTFGHAIEKLSRFGILHGDAISAGTVMALHYAMRKGLMEASVVSAIVAMMRKLNLNVYFDSSTNPAEMVQLMLRDKKSSSTSVNLILIKDIGVPYLQDGSPFYSADPRDLEDFLRSYLSAGEFAKDNCATFLQRDEIYSAA